MTDRLYYCDSYIREFQARVTDVRTIENRTAVLLDRSAFYPESGGQPGDTGVLGDARVVDVQENESGEVLHFVDRAPAETEVACRLDWDRRFDHMQQHTGQHLLSEAFLAEAQAPTISFHLGTEASTIDLDIPDLSAALLQRVEQAAQDWIFRNVPVAVSFCSLEEARRLPLRKPPKREGTIRVVEIQGYDWTACGGTHLRTTGELGSVLIAQADHYKGGMRIEFLSGGRAFRYAARQRQILKGLAAPLSAPPEEMLEVVQRMLAERTALNRQLRDLRERINGYETEELWHGSVPVPQGRLVQALVEAESPEHLKYLAAALIRKGPCLVLLAGRGSPGWAVAASSLPDLPEIGKSFSQVLGRHGGRGGGRGTFAQGGGFPGDRSPALLEDLRQALLGAGGGSATA